MMCPTHGTLCLAFLLVASACGCADSGGEASRSKYEPADEVVTPPAAAVKNSDELPGNTGDEAAVHAAWAEFKEASLAGKGEIAAGRVTSGTHDYYEEIRELALEASQEELEKYNFMKRYTVLGMRLRMPAVQLRSMSGREIFVYSVDHGWIGKNSATDEGIGEVTVTGDHARAVATKSGQPTKQYYHFVKEDGIWRLDMQQLMKSVSFALDQMLQDSGLTEAQLTKRLLEATTGKAMTDDLWIPPNAKKRASEREPE